MFKWVKKLDKDVAEMEKEIKEIRESQKRAESALRDIAGMLQKLAEESKK